MTTVLLTLRQRELLVMDSYAEYTEGDGPTMEQGEPFGGAEGIMLRDELRDGREVTVSDFFLSELREFADRDQDPIEQRVYRGLLRKAKGVTK